MAKPDSTIKSVQNLINSWDQYISTLSFGNENRPNRGGKAALEKWFNQFIKPNGGGTDTQPTVAFPSFQSYSVLGLSSSKSSYRDAWMLAYAKVRIFLLAVAPVGAVQQLDTIYNAYTRPAVRK